MAVSRIRLEIPQDRVAEFCRRWKVVEFALFGSVLRDDFRPDSDVDVLVSFAPDARWRLLDLVEMQEELREMFSREVGLVERDSLRKTIKPTINPRPVRWIQPPPYRPLHRTCAMQQLQNSNNQPCGSRLRRHPGSWAPDGGRSGEPIPDCLLPSAF